MADGWWNLDGAITSCVAAYQPVGAASLAASYSNLVSPGTHNAAPGTAPTWDATSGWKFLRASKQYLVTDIVPNALTWTYIIRFSNHTPLAYGTFYGAYTSASIATLYGISDSSAIYRAWNGKSVPITAATASGVHAMANKTVYWDGTTKATIAVGDNPANTALYIGKWNGAPDIYTLTAYIQAFAIYNTELTETQIGLLTTAMNALPVVSVDLTAADFTLAPVTFDAPTLVNVSGTVDLTALDFTLAPVTFGAPTLVNVWATPACRIYAIEAETRTLSIESESRVLAIDSELRGLKIECGSETKYAVTNTYNPLTAKDLTLSALTFDAPILSDDWWLAGGVSAANCIAAYQPRGAIDLADSYINLANPGTYNASAGTAPDWDAASGWRFNRDSSHWLETGIVPDDGWAITIKFSDVTSLEEQVLIGCGETFTGIFIDTNPAVSILNITSGALLQHPDRVTSGVVIVNGKDVYINGISVGTIGVGGITTPLSLNIGRINRSTPGYYSSVHIQAVATYNTLLTSEQVLAITNAVNSIDYPASGYYDNAYSDIADKSDGGTYIRTSTGARLVYTTSATSVDVETYNDIYSDGSTIADVGVRVNGVDKIAINPSDLGSNTDTVDLGAGIDKTVEFIAGAQSNTTHALRTGTYVTGVTFNDTATKATEVTTPRIIVYGDSIAVGSAATDPSLQGWAQLVRNSYTGSLLLEARGYRCLFEDGKDAAARQGFVNHLKELSPTVIWLAIGVNDYGLQMWSSSNFGTAYADLLDKLHADLPSVIIYAQTPIDRTIETELHAGYGTLGDYRTQIATAVSTRTDYCTLVQGESWTVTLADGVHPTTAGHAQYAAAVKAVLGLT